MTNKYPVKSTCCSIIFNEASIYCQGKFINGTSVLPPLDNSVLCKR
ncbi:hypothetical protein PoMZ_02431 [Pyricularia oryzae]|uniref:Uncharacterized protein n=2 Tax=Pyricularia TaxID=48558 RepID=Q8J183_PYRGI|nr:hypothetical protein [Pyricularia grisea]QBZ57505.1 hypothetical protein PoMZ_02431 [Pyricularia oryzae]